MTIKAIISTTLTFLCLDALWIKFIAVDLYQTHVSPLLRTHNNEMAAQPLPALLFYLVAITTLILIVIKPATSIKEAATNGALFGLFGYGTYAFTCQSIFQGWVWQMTVLDVAWGAFLCAVASIAGLYFK